MFAKICISSLLVSALCLQVTAHALISPGVGFPANPQRKDVKRPSDNEPCGGGIDIASKISTSTPVNADADGKFQADVTNFNGGKDGSREVSARVDPTGQGKNFQKLQVITNGDGNPGDRGTDKITAQLPKGIKCQDNNCLVQVETSAGFGNCIVVKQQGGNANANNPVRTSAAGDSATGDATTGDSTPSNSKDGGNKDAGSKDAGSKDAGSKDAGNNDVGNKDAGNSKGGGNNTRAVEDADATSNLTTGNGLSRRVPGRHMARL